MRERIVILRNDPAVLTVSSLTRTASVATATTSAAHGLTSRDYATVAGATPAAYNGRHQITVTSPTTFTFAVSDVLVTPATGTKTAVYVSDALGAALVPWRTLDTIRAEMMPLRAYERMQMQTIQSTVAYRFRVRARVDLNARQRVQWTPSWPPGSATLLLEITGVIPVDPSGRWLFLECSMTGQP
jgi:head-tail adaptor